VRPARRTVRLLACTAPHEKEPYLEVFDVGVRVGRVEGERAAMRKIEAVAEFARRLLGESEA
jgi:hypothetical protein